MREFGELFNADASVPQDLDHGPGPEAAVFLEGQIVAPSVLGVLRPDPAGGRAAHHRAALRLPAGGEQLTRRRAERGGEQFGRAAAFGIHPSHQGGQHGEAFAGALVHAGLALRAVLLVRGVAGADR